MSAQLAWLHRDDWTFEDLAVLPDDGYRYEILDGRLHATPPPGTRHQDVIENLRDIVRPQLPDGLRFTVGQGLRMPVLGPGRYVVPDAVIVTGSRPDLYWAPENVVTAIEVTSPGSQLDDRGNKKELYCEVRSLTPSAVRCDTRSGRRGVATHRTRGCPQGRSVTPPRWDILRRVENPKRRARLLEEGVTDGQLRARAYRSPYRGVHADASVPPGVERRIRDVVPLLPRGAVVGGWAAAWLHGATDLDGRRGSDDLPVLVCLPRERSLRDRPGIRVLRTALPEEDVTEVRGIPVTTAVRTAVDLARLAVSARRGVVAVDALWAAGATSGPAVLAHLQERRLKGAPLAREAAELSEPGVRSPQETELRMIWTLDAGLPRPLVNERIVDLNGHHLGRPDLLDEEAGVVGEYDGRQHRELEVATVDHVRQEGLERNGLIVARFTALDTQYRHRLRTAHRLRDARRRGLENTGLRRWRTAGA